MFLVTEGISSRRILETDGSRYIARVNLLKILSVICVHQQHSSQALSDSLGRIHYCPSRLNISGIHTEKAELSNERIRHYLECQRGKRGFIVSFSCLDLIVFGIYPFNRRNIQRGRHVVDYCVKQLLHAFIFVRCAAHYGHHMIRYGCLADRGFDLILGNLFAIQIQFHNIIIEIRNGLEKTVAVPGGKFFHVFWDLFQTHIFAEIVIIYAGVHLHQVYYASEILLSTDRQLDRNCVALEPVVDHPQNIEKICAHDVHFIDIYEPRNIVVIRLTPYCLGLGLDSSFCAKNSNTSVENSERSFDFCRKIHMTRGIDDVNTGIAPMACGSR